MTLAESNTTRNDSQLTLSPLAATHITARGEAIRRNMYAQNIVNEINEMTAGEAADELAQLREIAQRGIGDTDQEFEDICALLEARIQEAQK